MVEQLSRDLSKSDLQTTARVVGHLKQRLGGMLDAG